MFCDDDAGRYFVFFSNFVELEADCPAFIAGGCQSTLDVSDIITFQDLLLIHSSRIIMEYSLLDPAMWKEFEQSILFAINGAHSPVFNHIMWFVSGKATWIPFYVMLTAFIGYRFGWRKMVLVLLSIGAIIALADQTCATLIRPAFERLRPSHPDNPDSAFIQLVNGYRGGRYGFPSCHAANTVALAVFMILLTRLKWMTVLMITWSAAVCYSRMYLGVHYPSDILVGGAVGAIYAVLVYRCYFIITNRWDLSSIIWPRLRPAAD